MAGIDPREGENLTETPNILKLIEAGKQEEAMALLMTPITITAAVGPRSVQAALEVATLLLDGNLAQTARWMTMHNFVLGMSPRDYAEQSEEGLQRILALIRQIDAGVYA